MYGYNSSSSRGNLHYNSSGSVLYFTARLGVIYDKSTTTQLLFHGHSQDISSLAVAPSGKFAASSVSGLDPVTKIWDAITAQEVAALPIAHKHTTKYLAFSPDDKQLVTVGIEQDGDHSLAVYLSPNGTWTDAHLLVVTPLQRHIPLFVAFLGNKDFQIATGGVDGITFWSMKGVNLSSKAGLFGKTATTQPLICAALLEGSLVTGTQSGHLYVWCGRECLKVTMAHDGPILTIVSTSNNGLISGGVDGFIKMWDNDLVVVKQFHLPHSNVNSTVFRALAVDKNMSRVSVALKSNDIYEIVIDTGATVKLQQGFQTKNVLACAPHSTSPDTYAIIAKDRSLSLFSAIEHRIIQSTTLPYTGKHFFLVCLEEWKIFKTKKTDMRWQTGYPPFERIHIHLQLGSILIYFFAIL